VALRDECYFICNVELSMEDNAISSGNVLTLCRLLYMVSAIQLETTQNMLRTNDKSSSILAQLKPRVRQCCS
jgi:hypothetical protein